MFPESRNYKILWHFSPTTFTLVAIKLNSIYPHCLEKNAVMALVNSEEYCLLLGENLVYASKISVNCRGSFDQVFVVSNTRWPHASFKCRFSLNVTHRVSAGYELVLVKVDHKLKIKLAKLITEPVHTSGLNWLKLITVPNPFPVCVIKPVTQPLILQQMVTFHVEK